MEAYLHKDSTKALSFPLCKAEELPLFHLFLVPALDQCTWPPVTGLNQREKGEEKEARGKEGE